ncbi:MAG: hypothetical protein ACOZEN_09345 [Thermodesulfobacteriota bacterium]
MHSHHHAPASAPARPELAGRIARSLGIGEMSLNELDFDDLYVAEKIVKQLSQLAMTVLDQALDREKGAFISAFWVENSMELVLCADTGREIHLMRVPEAHWTVKPRVHH